jgi:hypothetical protein
VGLAGWNHVAATSAAAWNWRLPMPQPLPRQNLSTPTLQSLTLEQQRLLLLCRRIRFGKIIRLVVAGGQPMVRGLRWKRTVRVSGHQRPDSAADKANFCLKAKVIDFFTELAALGDAEVTDVEVWDGLPRSFVIEESLED